MSQPANLRLILSDHNIQKLALPSGIPGTVEELHSIVQATFGIPLDFCLHFKDADVNLEATFMAKLDQCTQKLMGVVSSRGGASGARIRQIKDMLLEVW